MNNFAKQHVDALYARMLAQCNVGDDKFEHTLAAVSAIRQRYESEVERAARIAKFQAVIANVKAAK
jgi:hypothetical protein